MQPDIVTDWHRLYGKSWKGAIEEDSFAHPAKFSRKLIRKIYDHAFEEGWLHIGDTVLDPFGGVALGAWPALVRDLRWVGVELEARFVLMGNRNIERWKALLRVGGYSYDDAFLYHGDSRYLGLLLGRRINGCVSSPPYARYGAGHDPSPRLDAKEDDRRAKEGCARRPTYGVGSGQLSAMPEGKFQAAVSSPPYASSINANHQANDAEARQERQAAAGIDITKGEHRGGPNSVLNQPQVYGTSRAQLGAMRAGQFEAAVSSPPFCDSLDRGVVDPEERVKLAREMGISNAEHLSPIDMERIGKRNQEYGSTSGQLGQMPARDFDACVSSPPFENAVGSADPEKRGGLYRDPKRANDLNLTGEYGETAGQLGTERGETFWAAARQVLEQTYQVLVPGARAIWVVKDFVRKGERVPFSHQWAELCIACGFEWLHEHRAWLVEDRGTQLGFFEDKLIVKANKSFFRRLAEKNGAPPIDWESVLCFRRP